MSQLLRRGFGAVPQDLVRGANALQSEKEDTDNAAPYFWREPRAFSQAVPRIKSIATPAVGVVTEILSVKVPAGFNFILAGILHGFSPAVGGVVWVPGDGSLLFTVDVDVPVGATAVSGYGLPDMSAMAEPRGSLEQGPFPVDGYNVFGPYQTLRYKVITTAAIPVAGGNFVFAGLCGWFDKQ